MAPKKSTSDKNGKTSRGHKSLSLKDKLEMIKLSDSIFHSTLFFHPIVVVRFS